MPDWGAFGKLAQNAASSLGSDETKNTDATKTEESSTSTGTGWSAVGTSLKQAYTDSDGGKKVDWSDVSGVAKQAVGAYQTSQKDDKPDDWQAVASEVGRGFMRSEKPAEAAPKPAEGQEEAAAAAAAPPKPEELAEKPLAEVAAPVAAAAAADPEAPVEETSKLSLADKTEAEPPAAAAVPDKSAEDRPVADKSEEDRPAVPAQQPDEPPAPKKEEEPVTSNAFTDSLVGGVADRFGVSKDAVPKEASGLVNSFLSSGIKGFGS